MENRSKKHSTVLLAVFLSVLVLSACSAKEPSAAQRSASGERSRPTEYEFPSMGMTAALPAALTAHMDRGEVTMFSYEKPTEDGTSLQYGLLGWKIPTESADDSADWEDGPDCVGGLGVYQAGLIDQLDELTGCDEHQELGQSADGAYQYYLSISTKADEELTAELRQIQITITEMDSGQMSAGGQVTDYFAEPDAELTGRSVGAFTAQDIYGNAYTQEIFQDYDLTMVNVFTTWCSPCVEEIPDLEELHRQVADWGVNVVGIVLDGLNEKGEIDQDALEKARRLAEQTGAAYPFLLPDETGMNGLLTDIEAFPETFFVDKDGNVVGGTYIGSGSLEDWLSVVEQELANLQEAA